MRVAMLQRAGEVTIEQAPALVAGPGKVLIQVAYAGLCGSDLHSYEGTHPFRHPPVVLGHEVAGTVAGLGAGVTRFSIGEAVTVMPYVHCGACQQCLAGRTNTCLNKVVPGIKGWQGTFAEQFVSQADIVYPLGEMSMRRGVLAEPFAVGVHAAQRAGVGPGSTALVLGGGSIGLFTAAAAHLAGAASVAVTDLYAHNLDLALRLGASHAYSAGNAAMVYQVRADYPDGFDTLFLASSAKVTVRQALALARRGARIVVIALFAGDVPVSFAELTVGEMSLVGTQIYTHDDFAQALAYLAAGALDYEALVTHELPLDEAQHALEMMASRDEPLVKALLRP
jgi:L-iditol 2-dehydrogenase